MVAKRSFQPNKPQIVKILEEAAHPNLYTVRVYQSPPQTTGDRMALIVVCLYQQMFLNVSCAYYEKVYDFVMFLPS